MAQTFTVLDNFPAGPGGWSIAFQNADGNFYAMSPGILSTTDTCGGVGSCGEIFRITPAGAPTALFSFDFNNGGVLDSLIQGTHGDFYGTTAIGGTGSGCFPYGNPCGTIFKLTAQGTLTTLYNFSDFGNPSGVIEGADGNFYGTFENSGNAPPCEGSCGGIFKMTPTGNLTVLYSFGTNDLPGSLVQGVDGNFYGITKQGGSAAAGTIFMITTGGTFSSLYTFCRGSYPCADGLGPNGLLQASDGNFYGTTYAGGTAAACTSAAAGCGTVFKITPGGNLTTLYVFCSQSACSDGLNPVGGLVQASDGNLYGTTNSGGKTNQCSIEGGCGTIFKITPTGTLTTLYNFCSEANCADGRGSYAGLFQATDRLFYGTTTQGGANNTGVFFSLSAGLNGTTASATSVTLSPSAVAVGTSNPVIITVAVSPEAGSGSPTGTVALYSDATYLGTAVLSAGTATFNYDASTLGADNYQITAYYNGDATFALSTSVPETLTVTPPGDYQISVSPSALTIAAGKSGTATFTVTPQNGFDSQLSFSCSGLPSGATCSFSPASVTPSNGNAVSTTLTVNTIAANAAVQMPKPYSFPATYALLLPCLGLIIRIRPSRRGERLVLAILAGVCLIMLGLGLTSCGNTANTPTSGNQMETSTITVTASTTGTGAVNHAATLMITIMK